jgi:gamma-glutamyltranspeptidase/glutathione hydrolase
VLIESGVADEVATELRRRGHQVHRARGAYGGYQGVLVDWQQNLLHGATESRKDGVAAGY